jgi:hypothetical protein
VCTQIRDLNSGTFGFVQLTRDKQTGELIACKFIERGDKVGRKGGVTGAQWASVGCRQCQQSSSRQASRATRSREPRQL